MQNPPIDHLAQLYSLQDHMGLLETLFLFSPDGWVSFNAQGQVALVNPAFVKITGQTQEKWQGLDEYHFISELSRLSPDIEELKNGSLWSMRLQFTASDKTVTRCIACKITPPLTPTSFMLFHKISPEQAEQPFLKTETLAQTAHALRTPLVSIHGFAELMLNNSFDASLQKEMLTIIREESMKLTRLINELTASAHQAAKHSTNS